MLDAILERLVEREEPLASIVAAGFDREVVARIDRLLNIAEYKRRQAAPGVKVTRREFRPRPPLSDHQPVSRYRQAVARTRRRAGVARRPRIGGGVRRLKSSRRRDARSDPPSGSICCRSHGTGGWLPPRWWRRSGSRWLARCSRERCAFLAERGNRFRLRHLLRALLGDDDVALLFGGGLIVDVLQRVGPGLSGRLARAGRVELLAVAERIRRRCIGLAVDRHRRVHVFAGVAVAVQRGVRGRAQRLAGLFVVGEAARARWRTRSGNRRRRSCGHKRCGRFRIAAPRRRRGRAGADLPPPNRLFEKAARAGRHVGILRPAIVLGQRGQHRAALIVAIAARSRRTRRRAAARGCW